MGSLEALREGVASARMWAATKRTAARVAAPAGAIIAGALALWIIAGVGFANYDTLYALVWGGQLARGETPAYGVPIAPTPHPLVELLGLVLYPLGPHAAEYTTVALGFLALSACGWVIYLLGREWFGRAAGALAALIFLTRAPVLSYGVRAYIDIPYLLAVLGALLVETRRRRAGAPVLALLAVAGLLRPEAWAFSGLYLIYLVATERSPALRRLSSQAGPDTGTAAPGAPGAQPAPRGGRELAWLVLLAASAPLVWLISDLAVTGKPLWSLTNTRHTASTLKRVTGIANVPEYIPRRLGEVLRPPVLLGAAVGGVLALLWVRRRAALAAIAGVTAVVVFAAFATIGLPINTRYGFLTGAILCIFCGAGVFGWKLLEPGDGHRRIWQVAAVIVAVALVAYTPASVKSAHHQLRELAAEHGIEDELVALVGRHEVRLACGPVGVPNHAPVPLLALYLKTSPARIVSPEAGQIRRGTFLAASPRALLHYVLDPNDPHALAGAPPPGFAEVAADRSWRVLERCPPAIARLLR
ncbi:MAG TPA: hypothetical protein VMI13_08555 [Solirubrobacteraceae bacterium]|nr:hypothetical protein [Solirubrobacteraceae bacterium]